MENKTENYSLKIKYDSNNKQKIVELLTSYKLGSEELSLKYAKNWLVVKNKISAETYSELEKKLLEVDGEIVVEKVKCYTLS